MPLAPSFLSTIDESLIVRLYGTKVNDLSVKPADKSRLITTYGTDGVRFAWLHGAKVLGRCLPLPKPLLVIVPDNDVDPEGCDVFSDPNQYRMWTLPKGSNFVSFEHQVGSVEDVVASSVSPRLDTQVDFHIHDVQLVGTVISAKLRSYLHLHQSGPFGTTIFDITVVDRDDTFSFDFNTLPCVTIYSIGVASAQICFHVNPNRICGEVVVGIDLPVIGHWGQTFTVACVNL